MFEDRPIASCEMVQRLINGAYLVKAFYIMGFHRLLGNGTRPTAGLEHWAIPFAGDDVHAKTELANFMDAVGFDTVDCGTVAER
ncbi:MAG: hypothetical protein V1844_03830 [Pseudomonadota bacterium]